MKTLKLIVALFAVAIMATGCGLKDNETIMTINNDAVTKKQFDEAFDAVASKQMFGKMGVDLKKDPNSMLNLMLRERIVNELIVKTLIDQKIEERKITVSDAEVEEALKKIEAQVGDKAKFEEVLKKNGVTLDQLKKDLTEELKITKLVDSLSLVSVGESEAKKYYDEHKSSFEHPDKVRAAHILISANPAQIKEVIIGKEENKGKSAEEIDILVKEDMNSKHKIAEEILAKVKANKEDFAKIAKEKSDDTMSALQGGDLGYFAKEEMVPEFSEVAFSMKPGTVSEIVQTQYGYHIILVSDRVAAGVDSFDKVKNQIIEYMQTQEKLKILQDNIDNMRKTADIKYLDDAYNPEKIQEKIKAESEKLQKQMDEAQAQATQEAEKAEQK
ncbi:peptidylprolyl isomerase [bacterium]|nr:peptidylprolyl isomerase [bacterium]